MATNEIKMEDYPAHWNATLMGEAFWKDAEKFNQPISDSIDANSHPSLLSKFPFNISEQPSSLHQTHPDQAQAQDQAQEEVDKKRRRRFSTSDALRSFASFASTSASASSSSSGSFPVPSRAFDLRRGRSQSRASSPSRPRRSTSILRSTFNMLSTSSSKSPESATQEPKRARIPANQATPTHPLLQFRGGEEIWAALDKGRRSLGLDVFLPVGVEGETASITTTITATATATTVSSSSSAVVSDSNKTDSEEDADEGVTSEASTAIMQRAEFDILPTKELEPLCQFRKLRSLKITGMMQSYQKEIWQVAWLNVELEELELGMELKPRIKRPYVENWPYIKGGWSMNKAVYGEPVYYGTDMSTGVLHRRVGCGEYLDKIVMEKAKICALAVGRCRQRLSIKTLKLTGFVVDADPFLHWFDPKRLKTINFKDFCVDAGFYLSVPMAHVCVQFPREVTEHIVVGRTASAYGDLKVVRLEGGKKVGEIQYRGPESLREEIPRNLV